MRSKQVISTRPADQTADDVSRRLGPALAEAVETDAARLPAWASTGRPGWVAGGPLGVACPIHREPLVWWTWAHGGRDPHEAAALRPVRRVPTEDARSVLRRYGALLDARAVLDAELTLPGTSSRAVYVLEARVPGHPLDWVYVGETALRLEDRVAQHSSGSPGHRLESSSPGEPIRATCASTCCRCCRRG